MIGSDLCVLPTTGNNITIAGRALFAFAHSFIVDVRMIS